MEEYTVKVDCNGNRSWYQNDKLNRLDGPAIENVSGYKAWYIEGEKLTEEEFNNRNNKVKAMNIDIDKTASDEVNGRMKRLVSFIFGEPIWTEDHDGEMRKRRMRRLFDGRVAFHSKYYRVVGNADGSMVNERYVARWYRRDSIIG